VNPMSTKDAAKHMRRLHAIAQKIIDNEDQNVDEEAKRDDREELRRALIGSKPALDVLSKRFP